VLCILYVEDNEDKLSDSGRRVRQSANPATAETTARDVQAAARGIGSQVEGLDASTSRAIDGAFATAFFREPPDAFFVGGNPLFGRRQ
jgi:hypothetical protein